MSIDAITSERTDHLLSLYDDRFDRIQFSDLHNEVYEPTYYFLNAKGKRIRPLLLLHACEMFGGKVEEALDAAFGIELFHNFTLIHDDIMDEADIRRGRETVHKKYGEGTAILTGDFLMILSYRFLAKVKPHILPNVLNLFNQTATQIIEGQVMDAAFESSQEVTEEQYLEMIAYKTSLLLAASLKIGAMIAEASPSDQELIYQAGKDLGLAFQVKDDWLDVYGDDTLGKRIGGDIIRNKKTYLFIKAWNSANDQQKALLRSLNESTDEEYKISETIRIYNEIGVGDLTESLMKDLYQKAISSIEQIKTDNSQKSDLLEFANRIYQREY